jgi:hypothetical protein
MKEYETPPQSSPEKVKDVTVSVIRVCKGAIHRKNCRGAIHRAREYRGVEYRIMNTRLPKLYIADAIYLSFILLYAMDTALPLIGMSGQVELRILK